MQNGTPFDIPLTVNMHIEAFSGGVITKCESCSTNIILDQYQDGRWYVTQRPGINQAEDASASVADARGRGNYYWDAVDDNYIVNNNKVYKGGYSGTAMTITAGVERVFIDQVGDNLVIIDQENDEGWYITAAAPTVINAIADLDFPPNQTPALPLARGGAVINGKLYVMTTGADIYESDIEDPTSWGALNFRNAEIEPDKGIYLDKHQEHVIAFGSRSMEFFQDVGNPTGSTLAPRTDINYQVGMIDKDCVWRIGDTLYFVGQDRSNAIQAYALSNFQLRPISPDDMSTFLTTAATADGVGMTACGFISGGREFFVLTMHNTITDLMPVETIVYSGLRGWWGFWDIQVPDVDFFPLVSWTQSTNTRAGEGLLINGDLVNMLDDFNPQDTVMASAVFEDGVFEDGVFSATAASGAVIPFEITTGVVTGGSPRRKRMGDLWAIFNTTDVSEDITIAFADEQNDTFTDHGTIDVSDSDARLNRCGSFRRRNIRVSGALSKQWSGEKLQATMRIG